MKDGVMKRRDLCEESQPAQKSSSFATHLGWCKRTGLLVIGEVGLKIWLRKTFAIIRRNKLIYIMLAISKGNRNAR